ncbi:hypothetical protein BH23CHL2_BH23CHL2_16050 [soil metagenome]
MIVELPMKTWRLGVILVTVGLVVPMFSTMLAQGSKEATENERFQLVWSRTDKPVENGDVERSWIWGEASVVGWFYEDYQEAPDGTRLVQYFDKTRMEITHPDGDPDSIWHVTNGLLVVELISGRIQVGDAEFVDRLPAEKNVAGDADGSTSPTYATFASLLDAPPLPFDQAIIQRLDRDGTVTNDAALADFNVHVAQLDGVTGHAIAEPFWSFMNSSGTIYESGELTEGLLFYDPLFGTGRPISEAYWANVPVAGVAQDVLIQCFERRCLTYTPANEPAWRVEAGNVGQHYMTWRYAETAPRVLDGKLAYVVDDEDGSSLWVANPDRTEAIRIVDPGPPITKVDWLPDGSAVAFIRGTAPANQSLYVVAIDGGQPQALIAAGEEETFRGLSVSPGGDWIMLDRSIPNHEARVNTPQLEFFGDLVMVSVDGAQQNVPFEPREGGRFVPSWSPDGRLLAVHYHNWWGRPAGGGGKIDNYAGDILVMNADGTNVVTIIEDGSEADHDEIAWSPDSTSIAFRSEYSPSDGIIHDSDIIIARADGSAITNMTDGFGGRNDVPVWTSDGQFVTFRHDALDYSIYGYAQDTLYNVDVDTAERRELAAESEVEGLGGLDWAPQGDLLLAGGDYGHSISLYENDIWRFIGNSEVRGWTWSADGEHILVVVEPSWWYGDPNEDTTWVFGRDGVPIAAYEGDLLFFDARLDMLD